MERTQINIRIDKEELGEWVKRAGEEGKSLSAWIREQCNGRDKSILERGKVSGGGEDGPIRGKGDSDVLRVGSSVAASEEDPAGKKRKTCPHGLEVGWRCTLCGGIVK